MSYTIGIDIGGTNTDAVLVDAQEKILAFAKVSTSENITTGFEETLTLLLTQSPVPREAISTLVVGTTHATNAILEQQDLYKVGVMRLAGQYPESPPPCFGWPKKLAAAVLSGYATVSGGFECHGGPISPLNPQEIEQAVKKLLQGGAESLAIVGTFSPLNAEQELRVKEIAEKIGDKVLPIALSYRMGGIGFLERENSTILGAALKKVMGHGFQNLHAVMRQLGLSCPLAFTQNDGSRISLEEALATPILTLSAGPTNSFVGASKLGQCSDAIIVDIGGTSTDIGLIKGGICRRSLNLSNIGGVKLNLPMPDVLSLALGGGSQVDPRSSQIGPKSVGRALLLQALSFGGPQLTLTDVALAARHLHIKGADPTKVPLTQQAAYALLRKVVETIEAHIALISPDHHRLPILLVGGGAALLPPALLSMRTCIPTYASIANAYGAALSDISGSVDTVVSLTDREQVLQELKIKAIAEATRKGARTAVISDIQITPYHYAPNHMARVVTTARGKAT